MSRTIQAVRAVGLAGLAVLAFTASPMLAPASVAQEREQDRRVWRGLLRADGDEWLTRPMLGVMIAGERDGAVLVGQVLAGSPAEEAGIVEGDLIVSVDGHDLSEPLEAEDELDFDPDRSLPEERRWTPSCRSGKSTCSDTTLQAISSRWTTSYESTATIWTP